eukprot:tig00021537_g22296.t1
MHSAFCAPAAPAAPTKSRNVQFRSELCGQSVRQPVRSTARAVRTAVPVFVAASAESGEPSSRRRFVANIIAGAALLPALLRASPALAEGAADAAVTEKIYFDVTINARPVGRLVIGLFGNDVPNTAKSFAKRVQSGPLTYRDSAIVRVVPGSRFEGGRIRESNKEPLPGQVYVGGKAEITNPELLDIAKYSFKHDVGGLLTVSEDGLQFAVTSAPAPELDGKTLVIGRVLEGQEVLDAVDRVPIVRPDADKRFFVGVGEAIGDARAGKSFYKPLTKIKIAACGTL